MNPRIIFGAKNMEDGMRLLDDGYGKTVPGKIYGKSCRIVYTTGRPVSRHMHLEVEYKPDNTNDVHIAVEYAPNPFGHLLVCYKHKVCREVYEDKDYKAVGWKRCIFQLGKLDQDSNPIFRLEFSAPIYVHKVEVLEHRPKHIIQYKYHTNLNNIFIELTNICNLDCEFCPKSIMKRKKGAMEYGLVKKIIDDIARIKFLYPVHLHLMGEPLLYPRITDVIRYAKTKNIEIMLFTNASLLNREIAECLIDAGLHKIILSIQTPDKKTFRLKKAGIRFENYMEHILDFIRMKYEKKSDIIIEVHVMNTRHNRFLNIVSKNEDAIKIINFWTEFAMDLEKEYGLRHRNFEREHFEYILDRSRDEVIELADGLYLRFQSMISWGNSLGGGRVMATGKGYCNSPFEQLVVYWDGSCSCCCLDYDRHIFIGNIKNSSLEKVWLGKRIEEIRKNMEDNILIEPFCRQCKGVSRSSILNKIHNLLMHQK